jgi:uncharacterized protein (TIGR00251 family)
MNTEGQVALPGCLRAQADGTLLSIKLQPRASKNEIGEALGPELKVKVCAPPVESAANEALLQLLAERLACPRGAVQLVRGGKSRHKVVWLKGLAPMQVMTQLFHN